MNHNFTQSLPMMLYRALDVVMPRFRVIFKEFGLTEQQWRVLRILWEQESITLGFLAEVTLIPAPSLVGILDRLADQGLVLRVRSDSDRRSVLISATDEGKKLHLKVKPKVEKAYAQLQELIGSKEWQIIIDNLEKVIVLGSQKNKIDKVISNRGL